MNPKVSVIIPTYNRAATVRNAIESVLGQTFSDLEVIVVDDGSSDGTDKILQESYGDRIRYFAQTNQGVSAARNKGLAEARGEWIALLDSDDLWEKEKLEWQFKALERFGPKYGACYTDTGFFNYPETRTMFQLAEESYRHEEVMGVNTDVLRVLLRPGGGGMMVCTCTLLARADLVARLGGFDTNLRFGEDSEFMFRLGLLTDFCYVNLPLVMVDRSPAEVRHVGTSAEWNKLEFWLRDTQFKLEGLLGLGDAVPQEIRKLIQEQLAAIHSGWVNWYLETGQNAKAREAAFKAAKLDLTLNVAVKWLLTWISPPLALRAVQHHQQRRQDLVPFI
jgi:glycosyltransferase involved in cell wall biosynthesis